MAQDLADRKVAEARIERYAQQLERTFIQTVALVTTLGELRDPYTAGHEGRVSELAVAIGIELGLGANRLEGIRVGAYLHDIGKMSIPSELLVKPTRLTPLETSLIREHAHAGHTVLERVDFPWPVAKVALQHHERMDGSGYPDGLRGDEIILEARIVAVADVVESMASHRPYRPALGLDVGLAEIEQGAGVLYDQDVTLACLRLFREKSFRFST
jgi:putative nucleotidyltransferase with HDIG domain